MQNLDGSLLIGFLLAEGFIETFHAGSNEVTCVFAVGARGPGTRASDHHGTLTGCLRPAALMSVMLLAFVALIASYLRLGSCARMFEAPCF
jgi:hypothetical protein